MDNESQFLNLWYFGGSRFVGTCYKAANWIYLGDTTGRGKNDQTHKPNRSIKAVWGYPLTRDFRAGLCGGGALPVSQRESMKSVDNKDKIAIKAYNHY